MENPGRIPSWETATWDMVYPSQGTVPRAGWYEGRKIYGAVNDLLPSLGAIGPSSRWESLSASMNLQALLTVLVTGRISLV